LSLAALGRTWPLATIGTVAILSNGSAPSPALPRSVADAQHASYEPIMRAIASARRNVVYLPVLSRLCERQTCPLFRGDGVLLYRDGDHLSRTASESLAPVLDVVFQPQPTAD
jgi:hypothetical protein